MRIKDRACQTPFDSGKGDSFVTFAVNANQQPDGGG